MKSYSFFILIGTLCACATTPEKLAPEDVVWDESVMSLQWETMFKNIINGFQFCNSGIPQCHVFQETRHAVCDIYRIKVAGGASARKIGLVEVQALDDTRSRLKLGIHQDLVGENTLTHWRDYAAGIYACREEKAD